MRDNAFASLSLLGVLWASPACNVGPDFVRPKVTVNAAWSETDDPRLERGRATDPKWWRGFEDPTLNAIIELAYHENLTLQIAGLRIMEARAALGVATGEQYPSNVRPIGSASAVKTADLVDGDLDTTYGEFQVGFDAVWELDFWGKYRRGVRAARAEYLASVADYDDALVSLTAEVARTYVVIRTFEELIEQAEENVAIQDEGRRIAESRFRNGATSELDVAQATTLLETTRASVPKLQMSLQQSRNALATLLGRRTGFVESLLAASRGIPAPPERVRVSVPATLLRRRPDIRGAELRAAAQCERIGIAKAELYPSFVLGGSIGTQARVGAGSSTVLFGPGSLFADAGASVFWPILQYPRILENVRVQDAAFQQALVGYVLTVLRAAQEVEDGLTGYLRQQDAAVFAENAVEAAQNAVNLSLVQYREGAVDFQRVLDTQRVLLSSQNELIDTRSATMTNLIALYKALGGGWELRLGDPVVNERTRRAMEERTDWGSHFEPQGTPARSNGAPPAP